MAVKTITIDMEAYDLLGAQKRGGESFSKVIKRRLRPEKTGRALLDALPGICLETETLDVLEEIISDRQETLAASEALDLGE